MTSAVDSAAICRGLDGFNLRVNGVTVKPSLVASGSAVCFVRVYCEVKIALMPALLSSRASACEQRQGEEHRNQNQCRRFHLFAALYVLGLKLFTHRNEIEFYCVGEI